MTSSAFYVYVKLGDAIYVYPYKVYPLSKRVLETVERMKYLLGTYKQNIINFKIGRITRMNAIICDIVYGTVCVIFARKMGFRKVVKFYSLKNF